MAHLQEIIKRNPLSKTHYISGQKALNICDFEHHTGDWHSFAAWGGDEIEVKRFTLMGDGEEYNTNPYLGDSGIIDATDILRRMGKKPIAPVVWAANHERAAADMLICNALDGLDIRQNHYLSLTIKDLDDWFSMPQDKERVYSLLEQALPKLPNHAQDAITAWLKTAKETDFDA
ncbi:MAG: hypothetical protein J5680_05885 [Neisseriaceae bacterium]|nr:hypothetical protein [Neisseriaceae bacterium]